MTNIVFAENIILKNIEVGCNTLKNLVKSINTNQNIIQDDSDEEDDEDFEVATGCAEYSLGGGSARVLRTRDILKKNKKYSKALFVKYINMSCDGFAFWIAR